MAKETASELEATLSDNAYIYGRFYNKDMNTAMEAIFQSLRGREDKGRFKGITIDTAAIRKSVMGH